jgi:hypothetical protein
MSRQLLSRATELFYGAAAYARAFSGKYGVKITPELYYHSFGTPITADADGFINDATGTELPNTETVTYTFPAANVSPTDEALRDGILDVPRNIVAVVTHGSSVVAMTIIVTGLDVYGETMTELFTVPATGTTQTVTGLKAFKSISSVAITAAADAEANTLNLGTGVKLGLPYRVDENGYIIGKVDGATDASTFVEAVTTTATNATGDVRGTAQMASAPDGTKKIACYIKIADASSKVGAYGVTQA